MDVEQRVKKVIARHLKTDEDKIKPDSDLVRDLGADDPDLYNRVALRIRQRIRVRTST